MFGSLSKLTQPTLINWQKRLLNPKLAKSEMIDFNKLYELLQFILFTL
jgi:hypothetical protein